MTMAIFAVGADIVTSGVYCISINIYIYKLRLFKQMYV